MENKNKKNGLEWSVLAISGMLVFFTLGFLIYEMIYEKQTSPDIVVSHGKIETKENYQALSVSVTNKGAETAENVRIEIIVGTGRTEEKSQMEFQYLPGRSSVKGWATFNIDTVVDNIQIHVLGYSTP